MPTCLSPPPRLTIHALERMHHWGFDRDEVVAAIADPEYTYPHEHDDELVVVAAGRVRVPYNPTNGEVVTVMPRQDQDEEHSVSGWINLDARQAEKLLQDWGFQVHSEKGQSSLWTHPDDVQKRLIPFSNPKRGPRANGKSSFRTAAQVVGVPVNAFVKGPTQEWLDAAEKARLLQRVDAAIDLAEAPDPLGINQKVVMQRTEELARDAVEFAARPPKKREEPPTYPPTEEKILAGLLEATEPATARELSQTLGVHDVTARDALRKAVRLGDVFVVGKRKRAGSPADLFWYSPTWEQPAPDPVPAATAPEETPVSQPSAIERVIDLATSTPTLVDAPKEKLFTATGTPWPTGGILIQDEDGVFYVARKLVEEGR